MQSNYSTATLVALPNMSMGIRAVIILGVEHLSGCDYWKGPRFGVNRDRGFSVCPLCTAAVVGERCVCMTMCVCIVQGMQLEIDFC